MASLSNCDLAHLPLSCTTPSTETCWLVVSFIGRPFSPGGFVDMTAARRGSHRPRTTPISHRATDSLPLLRGRRRKLGPVIFGLVVESYERSAANENGGFR